MTPSQSLASFERSYSRAAGKKRLIQEGWKATLTGNLLVPRRGCWRKVKTVGLDDEVVTHEPQRWLSLKVGDRLHLHGPSLDQIQSAEVTAVRVDGWKTTYFLSRGAGGVSDGDVWCCPLRRAR